LTIPQLIVYENAKQGFIPGIGDEDDDDISVKVEEETMTYGREEEEENAGTVASP